LCEFQTIAWNNLAYLVENLGFHQLNSKKILNPAMGFDPWQGKIFL